MSDFNPALGTILEAMRTLIASEINETKLTQDAVTEVTKALFESGAQLDHIGPLVSKMHDAYERGVNGIVSDGGPAMNEKLYSAQYELAARAIVALGAEDQMDTTSQVLGAGSGDNVAAEQDFLVNAYLLQQVSSTVAEQAGVDIQAVQDRINAQFETQISALNSEGTTGAFNKTVQDTPQPEPVGAIDTPAQGSVPEITKPPAL